MNNSNYSSDLYSNREIDEMLQSEIADFALFTKEHQSIFRAIVRYLHQNSIDRITSIPFDINVSINTLPLSSTLNEHLPSFINLDTVFNVSFLSSILPSVDVCDTFYENVISQISKHFVKYGRAVLSSRIEEGEGLPLPLVCSLNISGQKEFICGKTDYFVWAIDIKSQKNNLAEFDFIEKVKKCACDKIVVKPIQKDLEVGFLVKLAYDSGYGFNLNFEHFPKKTDGCFVYLIAPSYLEFELRDLLTDFSIAYCGSLTYSEKNGTIRVEDEAVTVSSLVLDNILISLSRKRRESVRTFSMLKQQTGASSDSELDSSNKSLLGNLGFVSSLELVEYFNSSLNGYGVNSFPTPYGTYFSVKGVGQFFTSVSMYVIDNNEKLDIDRLIRPIFEHHSYAAEPKIATVKVLMPSSNASSSERIIAEVTQFFDIFSIASNPEYVECNTLDSKMVICVALVSEVHEKAYSKIIGATHSEDLIYALNYDFSQKQTNQGAHHSGLLLSHDEIAFLINKSLVSAVCPISTAGVLGTLYFLGGTSNLGFDITTFDEIPKNIFLNGSSIGHVLVTVPESQEHKFVEYMQERKIPATLLGHITPSKIIIDEVEYGCIADLKKKTSFAFWKKLKRMGKQEVKPYAQSDASKKEQVANMFDNIAHKYDFLNHFLSLGIDKLWRRRLVKEVGRYEVNQILDVATGTGDLAIALSKLKPQSIVGIDISSKMVEVGIEKVKAKNLSATVALMQGDSENINFDSNTFNAVTVAFGVRNFENTLKGINEIYRVLKPGGVLAVLEFAMPTKFPIKQLYKLYFFGILPFIGRIFSKDQSAYTYLPESVEAFPSGTRFTDMLNEVGFKKTRIITLSFGIANIYIGEK